MIERIGAPFDEKITSVSTKLFSKTEIEEIGAVSGSPRF